MGDKFGVHASMHCWKLDWHL